MATSIQAPAFTRLFPALTPVRVVATSAQTGTYYNGPTNSGAGSTFTYDSGVLAIDSATIAVGDRVLLASQTLGFQNGIYVCAQAGATGVAAVLVRAPDFQSIEHMQLGFFVPVYAGTSNAGSIYMLTDRPNTFGVDNITFTKV